MDEKVLNKLDHFVTQVSFCTFSKEASLPECWRCSDLGKTVQQRQDVEENVELKKFKIKIKKN